MQSHLKSTYSLILLPLWILVVYSPLANASERLFCHSIFSKTQQIQYEPILKGKNEKPFFKALAKNYRLAKDREVLSRLEGTLANGFGQGPLRITIWNTYKWQEDTIARDFKVLAKNSDLFLTQEAVVNKQSTAALRAVSDKEWWMAKSFINTDGTSNGVATGSSVKPFEVGFIRSDAREPFTRSPKMALISKFQLDGSPNPLLVINVHMINFVLDSDFESMLAQIEEAISKHQGPIIFGGDFNTWSYSRMDSLEALAQKYSLKHAIPKNDSRMIEFDHLFVRGLKVNRGKVLSRFHSSDHYPLYFEVELVN